jgi:hypothetical protein
MRLDEEFGIREGALLIKATGIEEVIHLAVFMTWFRERVNRCFGEFLAALRVWMVNRRAGFADCCLLICRGVYRELSLAANGGLPFSAGNLSCRKNSSRTWLDRVLKIPIFGFSATGPRQRFTSGASRMLRSGGWSRAGSYSKHAP